MEASQAGLAAGGNGQGDGGQGESQGPDVAALAQQLEAQGGTLEQMREFLVAQPWQQQPEPSQQEQEPTFHDDLDLSFLDPGDPTFDPQQVAERLSGLIDQVTDQKVNQAIQQHVDPLRQENVDARREREALALATEFPELEDNAVAGEVVGAARQIAEAYGQPDLAAEPWFWRMTYMAGRAAEAANDEGGESPDAAHLEGGGGARPGGQQGDMGDAIVNARRGRSALPFG